jgi:iron-regulated transporter 1
VNRGAFSSVEAAWQNAFELCSYISTVIFSHPEQFQWPGLLSVIAVYTAGVLYAAFVRKRRGHLLHLSRLVMLRAREGGLQSVVRNSYV